jgi:hypothetical protein
MEAEETLKQQSQLNRHLYFSKAVDSPDQKTTSIVESYDPVTGLTRIRNTNGVNYSSPITNGTIGTGDTVLARQGAIPTHDSMPYLTKKQPTTKQIKEYFSPAFLFVIHRNFWFRGSVSIVGIQSIFIDNKQFQNVRDYTPEKLTIEDTFSNTIIHANRVSGVLFSYVSYVLHDPEFQNTAYFPAPVSFECTEATKIKVSVQLNVQSQGQTLSQFVAIGVDRFPQSRRIEIPYTYDSYEILDQITCDASGTSSVTYETTVGAGKHFVMCSGAYYYDYGNSEGFRTEQVSGFCNITVEGAFNKQTFYIQNNAGKALKMLETEAERYDPFFSFYLTNTKDKIFAHIRRNSSLNGDRWLEVSRGIVTGDEVQTQTFLEPEPIPVLEEDWQNSWTSSYQRRPFPYSGDLCRDSADDRRSNFWRNNLYYFDFFQSIKYGEGENDYADLDFLLKSSDTSAEVSVSAYTPSVEENKCNTSPLRKKTILVKKLDLPLGTVPTRVLLLAASLISEKK